MNKEMSIQPNMKITPFQPSTLGELEKLADRLDRLVGPDDDAKKNVRGTNQELMESFILLSDTY